MISLVGRIVEWAASPKTGLTVAAGTTSAGLNEFFDWIPSDIGLLAALAGLVLTCVLLYINLAMYNINAAKVRLEIKALKAREKEREDRAARARSLGVSMDDL